MSLALRLATTPFRWVLAPVRWAFRIILTIVVGLAIYYGVTLVQVWLTSRHYEPVSAEAIIVMGAAQYNGVPSPDLKARLNQALILYKQGYSHLIVCTGYKEKGDHFTESQACATYLKSKGVTTADILTLAHGGTDSWGNVAAAAPELKSKGVRTVMMVTDPFHEAESMAIASSLGFHPYPTPTQTSPINGTAVIPYFLKEAVAVSVGRVIGFQHLSWLPS